MPATSYSFGSGDQAAERLLVLADVFAPTMHAILTELPTRRWPLVVDLGCGPGSTTTGLRRGLDADRVVGLEASAAFVAIAAERVADAEFVVGDVLADPWPLPPADLVYARFLLSHLGDAVAALRHWQAQLAAGGRIAVEEPEHIESDVPVFDEYLTLTRGLVASRGAEMMVGRSLAGLGGRAVVVNRPFPLDVQSTDAARMFHLNLQSWRDDPWIAEQRSAEQLRSMANELGRYERADVTGSIHWTVRQLVLSADRELVEPP